MKTLRSIPPRRQSYRARPPRYDAVATGAGPVSFATDGARPTPLDREVARQLRAYFAGRRTDFDLPWRLDAASFTGRVLRAVGRIGFGETGAYGDVARAVGSPRAARAVGQAVGSNPLPLIIPCHRVLAAGGRLGGFGCGLEWKRFLLRHEGITWLEAAPRATRA